MGIGGRAIAPFSLRAVELSDGVHTALPSVYAMSRNGNLDIYAVSRNSNLEFFGFYVTLSFSDKARAARRASY